MPRDAIPSVVLGALLSLVASACGDDTAAGGAGGGDGGASASTSTAVTTGSATSTSTSTTPGTGGDDAVNPAPCDVIEQGCTVAPDTKCTVVIDETGVKALRCEEPLGDDAAGAACERPTDVGGVDTCVAGHFCANFGGAEVDDRTCHALCQAPDGCAEEEVCLQLGAAPSPVGVCAAECDP